MHPVADLHERMEILEHRGRRVERRLRWWRGIACGVVLLGILSWSLPSSKAADDGPASRWIKSPAQLREVLERLEALERKIADQSPAALARRIRALERKLVHVTSGRHDVTITGANLHVVNGLGTTDTANGLGNLIAGYNELRSETPGCDPTDPGCIDRRTGSHNVVVGRLHNFSSYGGLVIGHLNEISGAFASISGGTTHIASGEASSISGGIGNRASGIGSTVSAGQGNRSTAVFSAISGGEANTATGEGSSISGGTFNTASTHGASVSGGSSNAASGDLSSVSGGFGDSADGQYSSISGGFANTATGIASSVSGGESNSADGDESSISGGHDRTTPGQFNWAAGPLFADF